MISRRSIDVTILAIVLLFSKTIAQPVIFETPLSPRIANYRIDVSLDTEAKKLDGRETLIWHNRSADRIDELQFHLYLNAFRNNRSTLYEESEGKLRGIGLDKGGWGFIEVTRIALADGEDLTDRMEFIQPDDNYADDKTVFRFPLPGSIPPGDSIVLDIDFITKFPTPPLRVGYKDNFFFAGQWFPKIGVYTEKGWNCHQFHAMSEFFADFGVYDVRITVPEDNIIGAIGLEVSVEDNGDGTATHYYHAEDVHDFAWTASPEFVEFKDRAADVDIRLLLQPDRVSQVDRYLSSAKASIEYLHDWIGEYPYPNLTIVDPRRGALNAGGMEYPTLITAVGMYAMPDGFRFIEAAIAHEFAHNYFYGLLASNEFEDEWLDEGFTSYAENKIMTRGFDPPLDMVDLMGIKIENPLFTRLQYFGVPDMDSLTTHSWEFYSEGSEASIPFAKSALMLKTLENYLGEEVMNRILKTYFERWKFKHPRTMDFVNIANEISGEDLNWFFDQALNETSKLDYRIRYLFTRKVRDPEGYDFTMDPFGEPSDSVAVTSSVPGDSELSDESDADTTAQMYYSGVNLQRMGEFMFPVELEVKFDDGQIIRETWDGKSRWKKFRYTRPAKLVSAEIDPDHKIPLDINITNNSKTIDPAGNGILKWSSRLMFWVQFMMEQPELLTILPSLQPDIE